MSTKDDSTRGEPVVRGAPSSGRLDELLSLAQRAIERDVEATAALVARVAPTMLRIVRAVIGPAHPDVNDVAQDAVVAFLSSLSTFRGQSTVHYFADRVALLTALAARRKLRNRDRERINEDSRDSEADEASASPLAALIASRRRALLLQLLDELPGPTAEALALHFILGYTVDEIARGVGAPANTVWSRLRLGKAVLRKRFNSEAQLAELMRGAG